jgi:hypothetical protein
LALLINVAAGNELGVLLNWHYVNHAYEDPPVELGPESLYSVNGAITYLAFSPRM